MAQSYQHTVPHGDEPYDDLPVVVEGRFRFRRWLLKPIVGMTVGCVLLMAAFTATRSDKMLSIMANPSLRSARVVDHPCFWCSHGESSTNAKVSFAFRGAFQAAEDCLSFAVDLPGVGARYLYP
eukprot:scaffold1068_cov167-Amphora_coffeaeformis.AAC.10